MIELDLDHIANVSSNQRSPEQRLWLSALLTACRDATGKYCYGPGEIEYAREWLLTQDNPDRVAVCDLANIEEEVIVAWARRTFPDYEPNPSPDAAQASQLRKELRRANPQALFGWAEKHKVSTLWALANTDCMLSQNALTKILLKRLEHAPVHPKTISTELQIPAIRIYQLLLTLRDQHRIAPLGNGSHGYSPKHYLMQRMANGGCHVNQLATETGANPRKLRGLVDTARKQGKQIACIAPGTFQFVTGAAMSND